MAIIVAGIIPEVNDKSIIMFFKKGLRDSSLIHELTMKKTQDVQGDAGHCQQVRPGRGGDP
jgi:hypothetical protein